MFVIFYFIINVALFEEGALEMRQNPIKYAQKNTFAGKAFFFKISHFKRLSDDSAM
jgi:hypothetical protein